MSITYDYAGRTVVVTGSARGIGLAIAQRFAASGAAVVMVDLDEEALSEEAHAIGATPVVADVSRTADVDRIVATAVDDTGRVDVVVNNAGILRDRVLWKLQDDDWDAVLGVHLGGTFRLTRACVPHFRERRYGRVVNVTSYTGLHGNIGQAAYAAAKAGIVGFTKTAAKELARFGVTVNAISPNAATRMTASIPDGPRADFLSLIPAGRFAEPEEIASGVLFLGAEESQYITGEVLCIDGGMSM
ncbi:MAG: SDR family oxidoreductase [Aeromicrobium sp.]